MTDQLKKAPVVNAETDLSGKKQRATKVPVIKWFKLGTDPDPDFTNRYFLYGNTGTSQTPIEDYQVGTLAEINTYSDGKKFTWNVEGQDDQRNHFTHFALCVKPVE